MMFASSGSRPKVETMFTVIYSFHVKTGQQQTFEKAWAELTALIYENEGSLGSRLHRKDDNQYIAYAQWPNRERWQNSGARLPKESEVIRSAMRGSCEKIETLFELDVVNDLLSLQPLPLSKKD